MKEITKENFDKLFVSEKMVVLCKTEDLAKELLLRADALWYDWGRGSGMRYPDFTNWETYKENTCYYIHRGEYGSKEYYEGLGFKIVEFTGFKNI